MTARHARALGGAGPQHTWARLFLTMPEAAALAVLLVCDDRRIMSPVVHAPPLLG